MDELTIEGKTYISSKRAAKITGYAKDYIGQLCREGRVHARLVGRSWYVLEDSIREHRFGKDVQSTTPVEKPRIDSLSTWSRPNYISESPSLVPELRPEAPAKESKAIVDMQSAWREWFDSGRKALPDGEEDFADQYLPVVSGENVVNESVTPEEFDVAMPISHVGNDKDEVLEHESEPSREEPITIHRSYASGEGTLPQTGPSVRLSKSKAAVDTIPNGRSGGGLMAARAACLAVAILAVVIGLIGSGVAERFAGPGIFGNILENRIYKYLAGASTVEKIR